MTGAEGNIMLIVDDVLFLPFKGLLSIFTEIAKAAEKEMAGDEQHLRQELTELYRKIETRQITEDEFAARETELLDRLDRLGAGGGEETAEAEESDEE
jgi:hypothetical protein